MSKNRFLKNLISIFLILGLVFLIPACRRSEVLVDVRYEMQADNTDEDQNMLNPDDQGQKDDRFQNEKDEDQDRKRDTDDSEGINNNDKETTSADQSVTLSENEKNNREWNDSPVDSDENKETDPSETAPGDQDSKTSDDRESNNGSDESEDGGKNSSDSGSSDNKNTDPDSNTEGGTGENDNDHNVPGGGESDKKEADDSSETEDVPTGTVYTATGFAAQALIMLDEGNKLLASDNNTVNDTFIGSLFTDTEIWWEGDGSSPISDENFSLLIEAGPEICFEISGQNTFTESQVSALEANGIQYMVLYPLDSWSHLKENVTLIAQATGDESAISTAEQYASWVDSIIGSVQACETRMNTLFIKDWDYSAQVSYWGALDLPESISGAAMTYSRGLVELDGVSILKGVFGSDNVTGVYDWSVNIGSNNARNLIYAVPYLNRGSAGNVSGSSGTFFKNVDIFSISSSYYSGMISATNLGDELFPAVITANDSLKELIENDPFWTYYRNENYYEIYVAPYGIGSITEGSLDSPLLAMWVSAMFGGGNSLEQVRSEAINFYSEFLGKDISGSVEYMYR